MTPQDFVRKWRPVALTERQTAQEDFGDLCRLLGEPTPIEADPQGIDYAFEKGASRATGGRGWATYGNADASLSNTKSATPISTLRSSSY